MIIKFSSILRSIKAIAENNGYKIKFVSGMENNKCLKRLEKEYDIIIVDDCLK